MQTISISSAQLRAHGVRVTDYVREVVTCGDEPGTLSGASLRGKAKQYAGRYARTRGKVAAAVRAETGVVDGLALTSSKRWARVWVAPDGKPVRLRLAEGAGA